MRKIMFFSYVLLSSSKFSIFHSYRPIRANISFRIYSHDLFQAFTTQNSVIFRRSPPCAVSEIFTYLHVYPTGYFDAAQLALYAPVPLYMLISIQSSYPGIFRLQIDEYRREKRLSYKLGKPKKKFPFPIPHVCPFSFYTCSPDRIFIRTLNPCANKHQNGEQEQFSLHGGVSFRF